MTDHTELRRKAEAATPGEWAMQMDVFDNDGCPESPVTALDGRACVAVTLDFGPNNPLMREANALYIAAANPAAIIALLDEIDALKSTQVDMVLVPRVPTEEALLSAAKEFYNQTMADSSVIIRPPSAAKRDSITRAGERLRAAIRALQSVDAPFQPDWANYRQGVANYRQGVADGRGIALEEAAKLVDEYGELRTAEKDAVLLVGGVDLSNAISGEPRAAYFLAAAIRALKGEGK